MSSDLTRSSVPVGARVQSNIFIEGVSHKIRRQIEDLERAGGVESGTLTVDGVPVDSYLTRFVWDEGKYPVNAPLKETVASIQSQVAKIEDDMKVNHGHHHSASVSSLSFFSHCCC
jgi:V-type H+-transporting ATPase subunit C